jgi:hypothetical protein
LLLIALFFTSDQPITQLNINATDRFPYLSNYTWVVTGIPGGLQYTVTDDKMGIYLTGSPTRAGTYTMNVILLYWDNSANKQSCSTQPVNFQFLCQVPISVTPSASSDIQGTALSAANVQFSATGGAGSGYAFSSNQNPMNGVTLTAAGALTGTWSAPSTFSFYLTVVDSGNCRGVFTYNVNVVCPTITISPSVTLPSGLTTNFYNSSLTSSGGLSPYTYAVTAGSLPTGFSLSTNGYISGTPASATTAGFTVQTTDSNNCHATATLALDLACPTINLGSITESNLVDQPYNSTVTASGGSGPYTFSVTNFVDKRSVQATSLPPGLSLDTNTGFIYGSPTATGTYEFVIEATDAKGCSGSDSYVIEVSCDTLTIGSIGTTGTATGAYSATLTTTGGTAPYSYSLDSGSFPPSLTLSDGVLSGTLTKNGTYVFDIIVTDERSCQATRQFSFDIGCPTITTTMITRTGQATKSYISLLQVGGGISPYSIVELSGLPDGIENDGSNFNFAGTPTVTGEFNVSITIADVNGCSNQFFMPMNISCAAFTFSGVDTSANVDVAYESEFSVTAGSIGSISYSVSSGSLPNGLILTSAGTLIGTPTMAGSYSFQIEAIDDNGCTGFYTQQVTVGCSASTLTVASTIESGQTGVFYTDSFSATGSSHLPYTYSFAPSTYYPSGVQKQVSADLNGWRLCYTSPYGDYLTAEDMVDIGELCSGSYMMLACANDGAEGTFYNLAAGETSAILAEGTSNSNGVEWYRTTGAWGFADEDAALNLNSCDILDGDTRTCWHVSSDFGGYRCGDVTSLNENYSWQRYVYVADSKNSNDLTEYELLANGTLLGLPTISGDLEFTVVVTDAAGCPASRAGVLHIDCGRFYVEDIATAQVTISYSQSLSISGGSGSYSALIEGLPNGLEYDNETNVLSGVPTTNGEFPLTISISDLINPCTYTVEMTLVVLCPPNYLSDIPPVAQVGTTYLTKISYRNMLPPLYFAVVEGMLPYGLSLYADGTIEGVPSLPGDYTFFVRLIQDAPNGCSDLRMYQISVNCGPIDISDISNSYMLGDTVDQSFASSNGIKEYNYTLGSGQLPDGLTLELDGHLAGNVTKAGFFRFSVKVQDTYGCVGQRHFVVAITCTASIGLGALPTSAMTGEQISHTPTLLGGVAPYTFEVLLGALPNGISLNSSSGQISGNVTTAGVFVFQLGVEDSRGCVATEVYTFNVVAPPTSQPPVADAPVAPVSVAPVAAGTVEPTSQPTAEPAVSGQHSLRSSILSVLTCFIAYICM